MGLKHDQYEKLLGLDEGRKVLGVDSDIGEMREGSAALKIIGPA
jgi:hypothetical protein